MPKKKKTLKQKLAADLRHKTLLPEVLQASPAYQIATTIPDTQTPVVKREITFVNTNPYLLQDIRKTAFLTLSLLALQLILFFLLKQHVVKIPGISY